MVALDALIWLLHDERRAARLLDVTGLTPDGLRAGVGDHATLAAVMTFLEGHEPDLLACAEGMDVKPDVLVAAASALEQLLSCLSAPPQPFPDGYGDKIGTG